MRTLDPPKDDKPFITAVKLSSGDEVVGMAIKFDGRIGVLSLQFPAQILRQQKPDGQLVVGLIPYMHDQQDCDEEIPIPLAHVIAMNKPGRGLCGLWQTHYNNAKAAQSGITVTDKMPRPGAGVVQ